MAGPDDNGKPAGKIFKGAFSPLPGRGWKPPAGARVIEEDVPLDTLARTLKDGQLVCVVDTERHGGSVPYSEEKNTICATTDMTALNRFLEGHEQLKQTTGMYTPITLDTSHAPEDLMYSHAGFLNVSTKLLTALPVDQLLGAEAHELGHLVRDAQRGAGLLESPKGKAASDPHARQRAEETDMDAYAVCVGMGDELMAALGTLQPFTDENDPDHPPIPKRIADMKKFEQSANKASRCAKLTRGRS